MKVALVYDRINKWGGAERVLLELHRLFPDAPLYTMVYDPYGASWAKEFNIYTSFLQKIPFAKKHHEYFAWLAPIAFESFDFDSYDLVISVTSAEAKGIITKPGTVHICYCLTPTRYLWSHYHIYFSNPLLKTVAKPIVSYMRMWDQVAATRPDHFIAISNTVKKRIKKYYDQHADVVYPPAEIRKTRRNSKKLGGTQSTQHISNSEDSGVSELLKNRLSDQLSLSEFSDYYLVVSRLVSYKRIDIAIEACNQLQLPLVIIGSGSDKSRLQALAGQSVQFIKNLTDEDLAWYYQQSRALILPQEEDFGLVSIEAQANGIPVIAYKSGGATETVVEGKTGEFFYPQTVEALVSVLKKFKPDKYKMRDCIESANRFNSRKFKNEFMKHIVHNMEQITKPIIE